ncbi:F-box protein At5g65850-like [Primulina tabacum]|uniref:F-box protein At5g65850-like n=1 Tax=Primulina tabacum TaxID=48773 RepID=UPI003F59E3A5
MSTPGNDSEEMDWLPHELITEILSWLTVQSLLRFKTVCKLWRDTIQEQNFTNLHMIRFALIYPEIMWEEDPVEPNSYNNTESFSIVSSLNGLLLERCSSTNKYRIRNPSTKYILHLPSPKHIEQAMSMRFVSKAKEYKLVSYHLDKTTNWLGFEVLTIGTDSAWRPLDVPTNLHYENPAGKLRVRFVGDVFYTFGLFTAGDPGVICLNVATEQFKEVTIPSRLFPDWNNVQIAQWNTKISITKVVHEQIHAWILEDYKKCKWGDQKIVIPLASSMLKDHPKFMEYGSVYITDNILTFFDMGRNMFEYDIKSGKGRCIVFAPSGNKCVGYRPSMVHFRGMQPALRQSK